MASPTAAHLDDPRVLQALRWAARLVLVAGLVSCVARGADEPADPALGVPTPTTAVPPPSTLAGG